MFVSFLINKFGRKAFQQFLRNYAADGNLRGSLTKITGMHLVTLEKEWLDYMEVRVSWIPLITSATTFRTLNDSVIIRKSVSRIKRPHILSNLFLYQIGC
jgi:hypothetical protein